MLINFILNEEEKEVNQIENIDLTIENQSSKSEQLLDSKFLLTDQRIAVNYKQQGIFFAYDDIISVGIDRNQLNIEIFDEDNQVENQENDDILDMIKEIKQDKLNSYLRIVGSYSVILKFKSKSQSKKIYEQINEILNSQDEVDFNAIDGWNLDEMITANDIDENGNIFKKVKKE